MTGTALWVYLSTSPLFWLTVTLMVWIAADQLSLAANRHSLVNPVLVSIIVLAATLKVTGTDYRVYFDGAQFVHFLLGPATVALAVPLHRNRELVRKNLVPMAAALVVGSVVAIVSAVGIALVAGASRSVVVSLAPKSVTAAVAMAVSETLGGVPALTATMVIATGILGAILLTPMMDALRVRDPAARGFAAGLASHGIGTARAFSVDPVAGAFAGIAMALNALLTPVLAPLVLRLFF
ncbi:LrgB family protein [Siculibacillus lacustris]|uniref:LrgB family protein n=1 Tax=Siculibacillus lacustris TaxID=1549641 RepID=A0A4V2KUD8_9HYPH|nr:LrgB family protein [Siculibacillus lacustris]TBW41195.1 LrgB family protein [Siculibacillus lacustris]